jgi:hypothetical protein
MKQYIAPKLMSVELRVEERILTCETGSCIDYDKQSDGMDSCLIPLSAYSGS